MERERERERCSLNDTQAVFNRRLVYSRIMDYVMFSFMLVLVLVLVVFAFQMWITVLHFSFKRLYVIWFIS